MTVQEIGWFFIGLVTGSVVWLIVAAWEARQRRDRRRTGSQGPWPVRGPGGLKVDPEVAAAIFLAKAYDGHENAVYVERAMISVAAELASEDALQRGASVTKMDLANGVRLLGAAMALLIERTSRYDGEVNDLASRVDAARAAKLELGESNRERDSDHD